MPKPVEFIMDVGANHNGDWARCEQLIKEAARIGCHAVKFQLYNENLYCDHPFYINQHLTLENWKLPIPFIPSIAKVCKEVGIKFHCTPFALWAVDALKEKVAEFKIGSYEILYHDLIKACVNTGKPVSISAGNCWEVELRAAQALLPPRSYIYKCDSHYPASVENAALREITHLGVDLFQGRYIGYSDHTTSPGVIHRAVAFGAVRIEFHGDLDDMQGVESGIGHVWNLEDMERVITEVREGERASMVYATERPPDPETIAMRTCPEDGRRPSKAKRREDKNGQ